MAVALGVFSAARFYTVSWLGERVTADLRNAVYAHVLRQSPDFFETTQTGEVLSRLTADTTLVQTVVGSSLSMGLRNAVMGSGALAMLVWTNPYVMVQVLLHPGAGGAAEHVVRPPRAPAVARQPGPGGRFERHRGRGAERDSRGAELHGRGARGGALRRLDRRRLPHRGAPHARRARCWWPSSSSRPRRALLWGLYQGTQAVLRGDITAGHLGQTVVYVIILAERGRGAGRGLRRPAARGRRHRAADGTAACQARRSSRPPSPAAARGPAAGSALGFEGVTFHYPSRPGTPALRDFSLAVAPGETVALVGSSGAGKSTVFQLLLRFYDPQAGRIMLDGTSLAALSLDDLRARIGLVPQDAVIFSTSAMENIRYGRPGASDEEVHAAARAAFADDFLKALPEGYDTFLGERGVRLSGGQRQRIAIARAMLKNPPLLLLDEATSALDAESERMVQAALESAMAGRTTLVIAHRLATVQQADRIVVLDHGGIVEQGTHATLVAQNGVYARLAALQFAA